VNIADCLDTATLALRRAENIEQQREQRERDAAANHAKEFVRSTRLGHIRTALTALSQIGEVHGP
jgi:hypothetical protein